jgi:hypothetical protein
MWDRKWDKRAAGKSLSIICIFIFFVMCHYKNLLYLVPHSKGCFVFGKEDSVKNWQRLFVECYLLVTRQILYLASADPKLSKEKSSWWRETLTVALPSVTLSNNLLPCVTHIYSFLALNKNYILFLSTIYNYCFQSKSINL